MLAPNLPINDADNPQSLFSDDFLEGPLRGKFERIIRVAQNLFDVPMALISLLDEQCKLFKSLLNAEVLETPQDISFCQYVLKQDGIVNIPETFSDDRFRNNPYVVGDPHVRFYAGFPIHLNRQLVGAISIADQKPRHIEPEKLHWLRDVAALVETEIHNYTMSTDKGRLALDLDQARLASMVDPLTSLWNRQGIYNILRNRMDEYVSNEIGFGVAILDIDDFKTINDTYGHDAGDFTLKAIGQSLIKGCRETDGVGRWGGEEFLLLINDPIPSHVIDIAERIRTNIEQQQLSIPSILSQYVTVTIGLTCIEPHTHPTIEELINKADQALYKGKRRGRNQVMRL